MQYDNIYNYKISYVDELGIKDICNIYSDNSDIYSLENLPDTTYFINVYHCAKKDASTTFSGSYLVGKPISLAELEEEMILTEHSDDIVYHHYLKKAYNEITSTGKPYTIFRIKKTYLSD